MNCFVTPKVLDFYINVPKFRGNPRSLETMPGNAHIQCPQCGHRFNVEESLARDIEAALKKEFNSKNAQMREEFLTKERQLAEEQASLERARAEFEIAVNERVRKERTVLEKASKAEAALIYQDQITVLSKENEERKNQLKELSSAKIENEQLKRNMDEMSHKLQMQYEEQMTQRLKEEIEKARKVDTEHSSFKMKEKDETIKQLKEELELLSKKAGQGSVQLQGEAQELLLEDLLRELFPLDQIMPVAKGQRGSDIIQTVMHQGRECGRIAYESKNTASFNRAWLDKLKNDSASAGAELSVLITQAMPEDINGVGCIDGVWICSFTNTKGLSLLLRDSLVRLSSERLRQTNKGGKMQLLYDYLTGAEFKMHLEAIVNGFSELEQSYRKERSALERLWKEREKQLQRILLNTNSFIGAVRGIAGASMPEINALPESLGGLLPEEKGGEGSEKATVE